MSKTVLVVLAEGFEEIEAITPIDVLRRAGVQVTVAGVGKRQVGGAHGVTVAADTLLEEYKGIPDAVVLPGGMPGAANLAQSKALEQLLKRMKESDKLIGAICAAPALVLSKYGILEGKKATCYPGFEKEFGQKTTAVEERVVVDGRVITSQGPGTALSFALSLVEQLAGPQKARELSEQMLAPS